MRDDRERTIHMKCIAAVGFVIAVATVVSLGGLAGCHKDGDAGFDAGVRQSEAADRFLQPAAAPIPKPKAARPSVTQSTEPPAAVQEPWVTDRFLQPPAPSTDEPRVPGLPVARSAGSPAPVPPSEATGQTLRPAFPWAVVPEPLSYLVARSNLILVGALNVTVKMVPRRGFFEKYGYGKDPVRVDEVLKGHVDGGVAVHHFTRLSSYGLSPETMMRAPGPQMLLFLVQGDEYSAGEWHLAGDEPDALRPASPELLEQVRNEVATQVVILRECSRLFPPEEQPLHQEVKRLIDATTNKETQAETFSQLIELGFRAVPAIITLMDDRRDLGEHSISLPNRSPYAFEALRHYGPELVVDAMAAILNQMTGQDFGSIHNGGSEQQRQDTINGWRIYLYHLKHGEAFPPIVVTPATPQS